MKLAEIGSSVRSTQDYFQTGVSKSIRWRKEQLLSLKKLLVEQEDVLSEALQKDLSKGVFEGYSSEIGFVLGEIDHSLKCLKKWSRKRSVSTPLVAQLGKSYVLPEPLGTVLIIGAWNYPIQLVLGPLVAAIAAGNCAVIKPSELSENCSTVLAELIPQYMDVQAFKVVEGAVEETTELLKQRFDFIVYTGGETVAKIIMRAAAEHLTPVMLELGGKSPCIVDSNCDLDTAAARIAWSKWMNSGQICVAPDYVIVEKTFSSQLIDAIKNKLIKFYGENVQASPDYGRIINDRHFQRLLTCLEGQNIVHGGNTDAAEKFFSPTMILDPEDDNAVMQDEIFGPILPIITVEKIVDAIPIVQSRSKPLALYIYTKDSGFEQRVLNETSAGNVGINDGMMYMVNPNLPFGGVGNSGMGKYHGQYGFDALSNLKTVMKRSTLLDPPLRYPPYTKTKLKIVRKLMQ